MELNSFYKPDVKIFYNGVDKTAEMNFISISINDFESDEADTCNIVLKYSNARPKFKDEIEIYVNDSFLGKFVISCIKVDYKKTFTIEAVSVDFMSDFVVKKNRTFENKSYKEIIEAIAKENDYDTKIDFKRADEVLTLEQHDQSDLNLCQEVAKTLELTFCVKNKHLIFYDKNKDSHRITYDYNANNCLSLSWEHKQTTVYKSCEVKWHNSKYARYETAVAGEGHPILKLTSMQKDKHAALKFAQQKLQNQNNGEIFGKMSIVGAPFFSGAFIKIKFDDEVKKIYY